MQTELATNQGEASAPAPGVEPTPQTPTESEASNAEAQPEGQEQTQLDDSEEVEYEGNKYKVPKAIAPALLRQADYTKKTQEVAEIRRAAEAEKARIVEEQKAFQEDRQEYVALSRLETDIAQLERLDWNTLKQDDWMAAQEKWQQLIYLRQIRGELKQHITAKQQQRQSVSAAEQAKLRDQTRAALAKEIPNWSPKAEQELTDYALKHGYKAEEVKAALDSDARPFRFLHKAFLYDQLIEKQRQAAKAQSPAEPIKPIGNRPAAPQGLHDGLSTAEWIRRRKLQVEKRR